MDKRLADLKHLINELKKDYIKLQAKVQSRCQHKNLHVLKAHVAGSGYWATYQPEQRICLDCGKEWKDQGYGLPAVEGPYTPIRNLDTYHALRLDL